MVSEALSATAAVLLGVAEVWAIWRWGVRGTFERVTVLLRRVVDGPEPRLARTRRLEREIWGEEFS